MEGKDGKDKGAKEKEAKKVKGKERAASAKSSPGSTSHHQGAAGGSQGGDSGVEESPVGAAATPAQSTPSTSRPSSAAHESSSGKSDRKKSAGQRHQGQGARPKTPKKPASGQQTEREAARQCDSDEDLSSLMAMAKLDSDYNHPPSVTGTSFLYDELMTKHKNEWDPNYPENPRRLTEPVTRCQELGLVQRCVTPQLTYAGEEAILTHHTHRHLELAKSTVSKTIPELRELSSRYDAIYFNQATFECALAAAGCSLELTEDIVRKKVRNGFAMVRPPGHHAMAEEFCGYCIFNNAVLAARHALEHLGLERVLIVDWDVHHGQGTQYAFYEDPRVLYFSIHRYEWGQFWPNLRESDYDYIGTGKGRGFNINVPLNKVGMTDSDYLAIMQQILMPVAYEFCPQLVLISAGYDAALGCPEGEMKVSPAAYAHFTHMLSALCQGRVAVLLEGGYCLRSLAEGCALTLRCLLGDPCPPLPPTTEPCDSVVETILNVIKQLRAYWKCFQYQTNLSCGESSPFEAVNSMPPKEGVQFMTEKTRPEKFVEDMYPHPDPTVTAALDAEIAELISHTCLDVAPHRVCYVFDSNMRAHKIRMVGSKPASHPERPDRISRIFNLHQEWGLLARCLRVESRLATEEEICYIHNPDYFAELADTPTWSDESLDARQREFNSIYLCKESFNSALLSAGSVLNVVDAVLSGQAQSGVCMVRPPGHHAEAAHCMGFCFFNNVAIASKYAQKKYGVKRILILDWDVHHGNATQNQFYDDPSVLFISLHRFENGFFYPNKPDADYTYVGCDEGEGFNVNIPFSRHRMGDAEYLAAFQQIVMPIAYQYSPELVLVSAGFDSAHGDPLGNYGVTPAGFGHMTHMLSSLANGGVVLMLEGGYNLNSISLSMATCTAVLLGDQCPPLGPLTPHPCAVNTICDVLDTHKVYWSALKCRAKLPLVERVHSVRVIRDNASPDSDKLTEEFENLSVKGKEKKKKDEAREKKEKKEEKKVEREGTKREEKEGKEEKEGQEQEEETQKKERQKTQEQVEERQKEEGQDRQKEEGQERQKEEGQERQKEEQKVQAEAAMAGGEGTGEQTRSPEPEPQEAEGGAEEGAVGGAVGPAPSGGTTVEEFLGMKGVDQMFTVTPLPWCPHLSKVVPPPHPLDVHTPCEQCGDCTENWICLTCYTVLCSRFREEHMLFHSVEASHPMALSYSDLSVWCYPCDSYVHNETLTPAKASAYLSKFGEPMPGI